MSIKTENVLIKTEDKKIVKKIPKENWNFEFPDRPDERSVTIHLNKLKGADTHMDDYIIDSVAQKVKKMIYSRLKFNKQFVDFQFDLPRLNYAKTLFGYPGAGPIYHKRQCVITERITSCWFEHVFYSEQELLSTPFFKEVELSKDLESVRVKVYFTPPEIVNQHKDMERKQRKLDRKSNPTKKIKYGRSCSLFTVRYNLLSEKVTLRFDTIREDLTPPPSPQHIPQEVMNIINPPAPPRPDDLTEEQLQKYPQWLVNFYRKSKEADEQERLGIPYVSTAIPYSMFSS